MPLTPLSREFSLEVPYRGLLRWTAIGENGSDGDIVSKPIPVNDSSFNSVLHGLYQYGSTSVKIGT